MKKKEIKKINEAKIQNDKLSRYQLFCGIAMIAIAILTSIKLIPALLCYLALTIIVWINAYVAKCQNALANDKKARNYFLFSILMAILVTCVFVVGLIIG